jgi:hypothetical protein
MSKQGRDRLAQGAARAAVDKMRETVPADTPEITLAVRDEHGELLFEVQALVQIRKH